MHFTESRFNHEWNDLGLSHCKWINYMEIAFHNNRKQANKLPVTIIWHQVQVSNTLYFQHCQNKATFLTGSHMSWMEKEIWSIPCMPNRDKWQCLHQVRDWKFHTDQNCMCCFCTENVAFTKGAAATLLSGTKGAVFSKRQCLSLGPQMSFCHVPEPLLGMAPRCSKQTWQTEPLSMMVCFVQDQPLSEGWVIPWR